MASVNHSIAINRVDPEMGSFVLTPRRGRQEAALYRGGNLPSTVLPLEEEGKEVPEMLLD